MYVKGVRQAFTAPVIHVARACSAIGIVKILLGAISVMPLDRSQYSLIFG